MPIYRTKISISKVSDKTEKILSAQEAFKLIKTYFKRKQLDPCREHLIVIGMNTQHQVIEKKVMFSGSVASAIIHKRELIRFCMLNNSAAIIVAHNHPSGSLKPSQDDINWSKQFKELCEELEISFLDSIIIDSACQGFYSLAENELM